MVSVDVKHHVYLLTYAHRHRMKQAYLNNERLCAHSMKQAYFMTSVYAHRQGSRRDQKIKRSRGGRWSWTFKLAQKRS